MVFASNEREPCSELFDLHNSLDFCIFVSTLSESTRSSSSAFEFVMSNLEFLEIEMDSLDFSILEFEQLLEYLFLLLN